METAGSTPCDSTMASAVCNTSARKRDRSTGSMVRLSMLWRADASDASPPPDSASRLARRRRAEVNARLVPGTRSSARIAPSTSPRPDRIRARPNAAGAM